MKINSNPALPNLESPTEAQELQQTSQPSVSTDTSIPVTNQQTLQSRQQLATEARGFSNFNASFLQSSLLSQVPTRTDMVNQAAKELEPSLPQMLSKSGTDPDQFTANVREELNSVSYKNLGALGDQDIMAIAFIVLMNAAKSAQEDLKNIMQGVKDINQQKQSMRDLMEKLNRDSAQSKGDDDD